MRSLLDHSEISVCLMKNTLLREKLSGGDEPDLNVTEQMPVFHISYTDMALVQFSVMFKSTTRFLSPCICSCS